MKIVYTRGGRLFARGLIEYSPKVTRVQVDNAITRDLLWATFIRQRLSKQKRYE